MSVLGTKQTLNYFKVAGITLQSVTLATYHFELYFFLKYQQMHQQICYA